MQTRKFKIQKPDYSEVTLGVTAYDCSAVANSSLFDAIKMVMTW